MGMPRLRGSALSTLTSAGGPPVEATRPNTSTSRPSAGAAAASLRRRTTGTSAISRTDSATRRPQRRRSSPAAGFEISSSAPAAMARKLKSICRASPTAQTISTRAGDCAMIAAVAARPSSPGMSTSMVMTSGRSAAAMRTAATPSAASPTMRSAGSSPSICTSALREVVESSTTSTRMGLLTRAPSAGPLDARLAARDGSRHFGDQSPRDAVALAEEAVRANRRAPLALGRALASRDENDGHGVEVGARPHRGGELEAVHLRHADVADHHVVRGVWQLFQRLPRVAGGMHQIAAGFEGGAVERAGGERVIDHQRAARAAEDCIAAPFEVDEPVGPDDGHQLAGGEGGRALIGGQVAQLDRHRPDDQLAVALHFIDAEGELAVLPLEHQQRLPLGRRFRLAEAEKRAEIAHGHELVAVQELHAGPPDLQILGPRHPRRFHRHHRHAQAVLAAADDDDRRAAHLGGHGEDEARAAARLALHLDVALQRLHLVADGIEAHAAPGDLAHLVARGEAGPEDELVELPGAHRRQLLGRSDSLAQGHLADLLRVEAAAVVGHLQEDGVSLLLDAHAERAFALLAARRALLR